MARETITTGSHVGLISSLPKWAANEIHRLDREVENLRSQVRAQEPGGPKVRHISLGYMSSSDVRRARTVRLMVQDETFAIDVLADLSEHDFTALMAGQSIKIECEL